MFIKELETSNSSVKLVKPDITRDPPVAAEWLSGQSGRDTLRRMGVEESVNKPSTPEEEAGRVVDFLQRKDQYNWMISSDGEIVGSAWVDLQATKNIQAPAFSIMIGDPEARGQGIGQAVIEAVVGFLRDEGHTQVFARHTTDNLASANLLEKTGFKNDGEPYVATDDGFTWQNLVLG